MRKSRSTWRLTVSALLCLWLLFLPVSSQASYTITAGELAMLEDSLTRLEALNQTSQNELIELKTELETSKCALTEARKQSEEQRIELAALKEASTKQEDLLQTANASLQESAKGVKRPERRLKRQRAIWIIVAGLFGAAALK